MLSRTTLRASPKNKESMIWSRADKFIVEQAKFDMEGNTKTPQVPISDTRWVTTEPLIPTR